MAEKLMTYALGRGTDYYDQPVVRQILRDAASNQYRWSSVILGIVKSAPFQSRETGSGAPAPRAAVVLQDSKRNAF